MYYNLENQGKPKNFLVLGENQVPARFCPNLSGGISNLISSS